MSPTRSAQLLNTRRLLKLCLYPQHERDDKKQPPLQPAKQNIVFN